MKTLLIILFSTISCYSQSFMTKMYVREVYKDTAINTKNVKVVWRIDNGGDLIFIWGIPKKVLYLTRKGNYPSPKQKKVINSIKKRYNIEKVKKFTNHIKVQALFLDEENNTYFITIYMYEGILIWINRIEIDIRNNVPSYFFSMTNN